MNAVPSPSPIVVDRTDRLQDFGLQVIHNYHLLESAFSEFAHLESRVLLARSERGLARSISLMARIRTELMDRIAEHIPGERCILTQLANYAVVAEYQYVLILEAKRRNRQVVFDWVSNFLSAVRATSPPCEPISIPAMGYDFDFIYYWLNPETDFGIIARYLLYDLFNYQECNHYNNYY